MAGGVFLTGVSLALAAAAMPARAASRQAADCALHPAMAAPAAAAAAVKAKAAPGDKVLYLTFDDGPSPRYTPLILDVLKREHVRATFFVLGERSTWYPWLVRRERAEGHEIGNHGYVHRLITEEPEAQMVADVRRADAAIRRASGILPLYFRPPGGAVTPQARRVLNRLGHPIALWSVDSQDWRPGTSTMAIVRAVMRDARPGAVVLFHDGVSNSRRTAEALPVIIRHLRARGYRFDVLPIHLHVGVVRSFPCAASPARLGQLVRPAARGRDADAEASGTSAGTPAKSKAPPIPAAPQAWSE
ncbi:hypothetical protein GCM10010885_06450 [Alicyclobacillus cellulosilyticus]|uniref:NodB homology domain-containing protein n=2 Tax=Alicyclobacillus cellulosilyticus TaxID=1003997 RepID=A0A917NH09_9BACL|nr:hypothetical protein GCM10010885_06450 [Alicyclobacillus cellulosilyticus]